MAECKSFDHDGKISAMSENGAAEAKQQLRAELKLRRAGADYDPEVAGQLNVQLAELCLANGAKKITCYLPYGDEPDTELFIDWAIENDLEVLLPVAKADGQLDWVKFTGETETGIFGFAEASGAKVEPFDIDLAIIPALAVDQKGARLGKGKGYYDRALETFAPAPAVVAVVFDAELLEQIPTEPHDKTVDAVVTPSQIIHFSDRLK